MNRSLVGAAQGVVTILLLVWLFRDFDWPSFRALYARLPLWYYLASLGVILAGQVLYAWRWRVLLITTGVRIPFRSVLRQYFVGIFVNNFLPSTIGGDAAKVFYLGREHGYRVITASVVLDRLLGLGILSSLATAALWLDPSGHPRFVAARIVLTAVTLGFALIVLLALFGTGGLPQRVAALGARAVAVAAHLQQFRIDLARAVRSPVVWAQSAGTVGSYFVLVTVVYQLFLSMQGGVRPGFVPVLMAVASTTVLSNIPIAVNGLGLREQLHVVLLEPLGVPKEVAVAISLLLFSHLLVASLAGGVMWLRAPTIPDPRPPAAS